MEKAKKKSGPKGHSKILCIWHEGNSFGEKPRKAIYSTLAVFAEVIQYKDSTNVIGGKIRRDGVYSNVDYTLERIKYIDAKKLEKTKNEEE